jgi:glycosyltransferase involved in cell wall biosynthesis
MHIGIDASRAAVAARTGTEWYSLQVIRRLVMLDQENSYTLYSRAPLPAEIPLAPPRMAARVMPFPRLWTHARLSWEMARRSPDVLWVPAHVLPLVHPRRSVVTIHDLGYLYHPASYLLRHRLYLRLSTAWSARAATHLITVSAVTKADLVREHGVRPDKVTVVYSGVDTRFQPQVDQVVLTEVRQRYGIPGPYVLYVGTLQPRKNLVRLVEAFSQVAQEDETLRLVLAGRKGWLYDDIFATVARLGLTDRVVFTGYVPDDDVPALMAGARLFVLPSLYEGFGVPVVEAMACGVPVVCANIASLPEVAGDAALLVDPTDVDALAAAIRRALTDDDLRRELIARGLRQAARFSWDRCAAETLAVLTNLRMGESTNG